MSSVRAQAVDLLERWRQRDARYPGVGPDIKALVHLHRSSAYRELRLILERWRP